jgi:hypothetical protein
LGATIDPTACDLLQVLSSLLWERKNFFEKPLDKSLG